MRFRVLVGHRARARLAASWLCFAAAGCSSSPPAGEALPESQAQPLSAAHWEQEQKLSLSYEPSIPGYFFGAAVALRSGTAVVSSAPGAGYPQAVPLPAVHVYVRAGQIWTEQQALLGSDTASGDEFGANGVAIDGDTIAVGAYRQNGGRGAVYIFTRSGGAWTEQQKVTAPAPKGNQLFGFSTALSGNTLLVSDYSNTLGKSRVFVYVRDGGTWTWQQTLTHPDAKADLFGYTIRVEGNTALLGSNTDAVVYQRSGTQWSLQQRLVPADGSGDNSGQQVALSGDTALVTAYFRAPAGAAYVFTRSGSAWTQQQKLTGSDSVDKDYFGQTASLSGDTAIVGSYAHDNFDGKAYVFERTAGAWQETQGLVGPVPGAQGDFGGPSAIDGGLALLAAFHEDGAAGAAYLFRATTAAGGPCSKDQECSSGAVCGSEGVCCDQKCDQGCQSCLASVKGSGVDGVCGFVAKFRDERGDCAETAAAGCGLAGYCDGKGACALHEPGTVCQTSSCPSPTSQDPVDACDGAGACQTTAAVRCQTGYACVAGACKTSCASSDDCDTAGGYACSAGVCKLDDGGGCASDAECSSGHCADSVCCNATCDGACEACAGDKTGGDDGVCAPIATGTDPDEECAAADDACGAPGVCDGDRACQTFASATTPCGTTACSDGVVTGALCDGSGSCVTSETECGPYSCSGDGCAESCADDSECVTGSYCTGAHTCAVLKDNGAACSSSAACASGFCTDGVCCESACDGQCEACAEKGSLGTCSAVEGEPRGKRRACGQSACGDGEFTIAPSCDGQRRDACAQPPPKGCGGYQCDDAGCLPKCREDDDCAANYGCGNGGKCVSRSGLGPGVNEGDEDEPGSAASVAEKKSDGGCSVRPGRRPTSLTGLLLALGLGLARARRASWGKRPR